MTEQFPDSGERERLRAYAFARGGAGFDSLEIRRRARGRIPAGGA